MSDMAWPLWTLEFTRSGSTVDAYPLDVGVACWTSPDADITTWRTAISPEGVDDWTSPAREFMDRAGMTYGDLREGMPPAAVAETLNDVFMTANVHGKGGTEDVHLASRLNLAAKIWPTYSLHTWRDVCERHPARAADAWQAIRTTQGDAGERAGAIMRAIAHLLGHAPAVRSVPTMAVSLPT